MSTDDPFGFLGNETPERKPTTKTRWREKLFSKDKHSKGGNEGVADQQIESFLAPVRSKSVSYGSYGAHSTAGTSRGLSTPRLDVSQRSNPQDISEVSPVAKPASATDSYPPMNFPQHRRKNSARKGLRVKFTDSVPEFIGEGGDESDVPTMEIAKNRRRRRSQTKSTDMTDSRQPTLPQLQLDTSFGDGDAFMPRHQRTNTSEKVNAQATKPLFLQSPQDSDFLVTLSLGKPGSRLSFRAPPESSSFAQRVRDRMQAEEGRALQHRFEHPTSPGTEDVGAKGHALVVPDSPTSEYETPPLSEDEAEPPAKPVQSPRSPPSRAPVSPPAETTLSSGLTPAIHPMSASPPKPLPPKRDPVMDSPGRPSSSDKRDGPRTSQPPKFSLRSIANQFGDTAFTELKTFVARHDDLIRDAAESVKPLMETSLTEWVRAATWWFMRGRKRLEAYARSRPSSAGSNPQQANSLDNAKQAVVDLGKALWICENIVPKHSELTRYGAMGIDALLAVASTTGDRHLADLLSLHQTIMNHLRSLAMSIKRNNIITSIDTEEGARIPIDTSMWLRYPFFAPDVSAVLSGTASKSMLIDKSGNAPTLAQTMPLGDTSRYFSYGSMFVNVMVSSKEDDTQQQFSMPCSLSIIRDRADWYVFASITSQSELVNIMIQSDKKRGPTWDDVEWHVRTHSMQVKLPRGFELDVMFKEDDFKNLWNIVQYTRKTEASLQPEDNETVIYENTMKVFQYMDPAQTKAFPAEPVERCRIRLFEQSITVTEGTGSRSVHQGYRITVLTSPKVKTLSNVRHILGHGAPIVFGLLRGEDGAPALMLKVKEDGRSRSMLMTFEDVEERAVLHSLLLGMMTKDGEIKTPDIPIRAYCIEQPADRFSGQPEKAHLQFPAGSVSVIDQEHAFVDHQYGPTILSEHLRAFVATEWGSVTDRINLGPGELKLGLDINNRTGLSLYRPAQRDLTVSIAENLTNPEMPDKLTDFMQLAMAKPMIRRFDFASVKDLHRFQAAVTGFHVLYDGVATYFTISRRRMVVPITKKWEATRARIQVIQHEKVIQLLAFLNDFHHGKCMNFVLKGTDTFENFSRSGKFCLRLNDAKFALPRTDDDPASSFVCLDMPDFPSEHDDIAVGFDSEAGATSQNKITMTPAHNDIGAATHSLHADEVINAVTDVAPPLHVSTTFRYPDDPDDLLPAEDLSGYDQDKTKHIYSRLTAPNSTRFEAILSSLLHGEAISYSSGLSALHAALVLLNPRRISVGNGYHGCHGVIKLFGRLTGLQELDLNCPAEQLEAGDVILLETPVNPEGTAFSIEHYAEKAHSRGAYLIVDSTFAPPGLQEPFQWGTDLVMHSGTKYFGGHSDLLCGVLATQRKDWARQLFSDRVFLGSVMGNMESWLGVRSLRTLEVRVQRQSRSTTDLVSWLHNSLQVPNPAPGSDEAVTQAVLQRVYHASLQKEDESWLLKQMPNGFGPVFSISLKTEEYARKLPSKLAFFQHATSLGGVETLIEWRTMSDATVDRRLLRISVGLENWEDLRRDLKRIMSTFQIHYFSTATTYTGKNTEALPAPLPLTHLFDVLESKYPGIKEKILASCGVSLNEEYVDVNDDGVIEAGSEVAIIPPVSSG
ncbi:Cys/Met metabolism PLP-dependent enzyme-domain-containing protein [Aspergillus avenaceus]|uniref:Molybdopterin synthase sulfur carrier subunit n=1 Tax=Aspergillus avenaceus TaxID=36643 RepID=A0A5N6TU42_ASPAV|nr:Cys/Met metabolism PLP-dependent enzyme-domain-containing protein [Aspergillus avenaceus]